MRKTAVIANVMRKEWLLILRTPNNIFFVTMVPVLVTVQFLFYIWLALRLAGADIIMDTVLAGAVDRFFSSFEAAASGTLDPEQKLLVFFFGLFPLYGLLIPCLVSLSFATFGIVEEKMTKTLEPLLATPVRTSDLLLGKALAALVPAAVMSFICAGIFLLGTVVMGKGPLIGIVITPRWWIFLFVLSPLFSLLTFMLGVAGSARAADVKSAQNFAVLVVLPILGFVVLQVLGVLMFSPLTLLLLAAALVCLNLIMLRISVRIFKRETILTAWK
ncbi:MAG: ABC transporter permease subunit [Spirochaetes bacterium]|nr:ABC transporter permease subunit [Spirochaetota bacterium]